MALQLTFDDTFDITNYGGKYKLFDVKKPMTVNYTIDVPVEAKSPEGLEIQKLAKVDWTKQMKAFKTAKEKEYKEVLAFTEDRLMKTAVKKKAEFDKLDGGKALKALESWLNEEVLGANKMIDQALEAFKGVVQQAMLDFWLKAAAAIDKKFKSALTKQKVKAVFKIIGWVGVILVAAAVTIAAAVIGLVTAPTGVTPFAAAGVIIAGVGTVIGAIKKIADTVDAAWPDHKKTAKALISKTQALKEALEYEDKKVTKSMGGAVKLGPKEKLKLMLGNVKGKKSEVESSIKDLGIWTARMMQEVEKKATGEEAILKKMEEAADKLASAKSDKEAAALLKQVDQYKKVLVQNMSAAANTRTYLKRYAALVIEGQAFMSQEANFDHSKLGPFIKKLEELAGSKEVDNLISLGKAGGELYKALSKLLK